MQAVLAQDLAEPSPEGEQGAHKALAWLSAHRTFETGGWPASTALSLGLWRALGLAGSPAPGAQIHGDEDDVSSQTDAPPVGNAPQPPQFDGAVLDTTIRSKIDQAASDPNRRGEAILLLIDAIGARGPARFAPDADIYFVATLKKLGLDAEARRLAIECLLFGPPAPAKPPSLPPPAAARS
jgi:hypothetical protein